MSKELPTLKPLPEYIKWIEHHSVLSTLPDLTFQEALQRIIIRTNFGQRKLTLGQFVPCDKEGKPMDKPHRKNSNKYSWSSDFGMTREDAWNNHTKQYQEALDRCLFVGFEVGDLKFNENGCYRGGMFIGKTIEDLIKTGIEPTTRVAKELKL